MESRCGRAGVSGKIWRPSSGVMLRLLALPSVSSGVCSPLFVRYPPRAARSSHHGKMWANLEMAVSPAPAIPSETHFGAPSFPPSPHRNSKCNVILLLHLRPLRLLTRLGPFQGGHCFLMARSPWWSSAARAKSNNGNESARAVANRSGQLISNEIPTPQSHPPEIFPPLSPPSSPRARS